MASTDRSSLFPQMLSQDHSLRRRQRQSKSNIKTFFACGVGFAILMAQGCDSATEAPPPQQSRPSSSYSYNQPEEKPARPENVADWTEADYFSAKKERDPKLAEAATYFASNNVGNAEAATFLADLLTKEPETEDDSASNSSYGGYGSRSYGSGYGGYGPGSDGDVGPAVIAGLGVNNTDAARKALIELIKGKFETEVEDGVAATAALEALANPYNARSEELFFHIVATPQRFRSGGVVDLPGSTPPDPYGSGEAPVTARALQSQALDLIREPASERLRLKLAEVALNGSVDGQTRDLLLNFLRESNPENMPAQLAIYGSESADDVVRDDFEAIFLAQSSNALATLLGVPFDTEISNASSEDDTFAGAAGGRGAEAYGYGETGYGSPDSNPYYTNGTGQGTSEDTVAAPTMTSAQASSVAKLLWQGEFFQTALGRLETVKGRDPNLQPLVLAGSMMVPGARAATVAKLSTRESSQEAAKWLLDAGAFQDVMVDPGLLLAVKRLPFKEERRRERRDDRRRGTRTDDGGYGSYAGNDDEDEADPLEDLLSRVSSQLREASGQRSSPSERPFEFHKDASVVAEYHFDSSSLAGKTSGLNVAPLKVHFARIEQEESFVKMNGFYRRKLDYRLAKVRDIDDGVWLERTRQDHDAGTVISYDVFIRRGEGEDDSRSRGYGSGRDEDERDRVDEDREPRPLVIEILAIEAEATPFVDS